MAEASTDAAQARPVPTTATSTEATQEQSVPETKASPTEPDSIATIFGKLAQLCYATDNTSKQPFPFRQLRCYFPRLLCCQDITWDQVQKLCTPAEAAKISADLEIIARKLDPKALLLTTSLDIDGTACTVKLVKHHLLVDNVPREFTFAYLWLDYCPSSDQTTHLLTQLDANYRATAATAVAYYDSKNNQTHFTLSLRQGYLSGMFLYEKLDQFKREHPACSYLGGGFDDSSQRTSVVFTREYPMRMVTASYHGHMEVMSDSGPDIQRAYLTH